MVVAFFTIYGGSCSRSARSSFQAIAWELLLIAVLLQFDAVRDSFGIAMPSMQDVGIILAMGFGVLISVEIVKAILRIRTRQAPAQVLAK